MDNVSSLSGLNTIVSSTTNEIQEESLIDAILPPEFFWQIVPSLNYSSLQSSMLVSHYWHDRIFAHIWTNCHKYDRLTPLILNSLEDKSATDKISIAYRKISEGKINFCITLPALRQSSINIRNFLVKTLINCSDSDIARLNRFNSTRPISCGIRLSRELAKIKLIDNVKERDQALWNFNSEMGNKDVGFTLSEMIETARLIRKPNLKALSIQSIFKVHSIFYSPAKFISIINSSNDDCVKSSLIEILCKEFVGLGKIAEAIHLSEKINDQRFKNQTNYFICKSLCEQLHFKQALEFSKGLDAFSEELLSQFTGYVISNEKILKIAANALVKSGGGVAQVIELHECIDKARQNTWLECACNRFLRTSSYNQIQIIVTLIDDAFLRNRIGEKVLKHSLKFGEINLAKDVVKILLDRKYLCKALQRASKQQLLLGKFNHAIDLVDAMPDLSKEDSIEEETWSYDLKSYSYYTICFQLLAYGDLKRAKEVVEKITIERYRFVILQFLYFLEEYSIRFR